ncbi:hydrogenase maturation protease [Pseudonocardia nematodicida]|uniref:Hydrogenase maturation protease n=1 Tax=Pseudonocardia nematodicida TaxID=1206997 RepID=A0ABV1K6F1_9PSEU
MTDGVLVAGIGNVFHRDDGFGVEVAQRLLSRGGLPGHVTVVDVGIRGIDLAYRLLDGWTGCVLVDALEGDGPPGSLYRLEHTWDGPAARPARGVSLDGHDIGPDVVLGLLRELADATGVADPVGRILVLGCEPADTTPGMGLSAPVTAAVELAADAVAGLVELIVGEGQEAHP